MPHFVNKYSDTNVKYMKRWYSYYNEQLEKSQRPIDTFTEDEIQYAVRTQFSWTHLRSLLSISDPLVRQFYMQMCQYEHCRRGH